MGPVQRASKKSENYLRLNFDWFETDWAGCMAHNGTSTNGQGA